LRKRQFCSQIAQNTDFGCNILVCKWMYLVNYLEDFSDSTCFLKLLTCLKRKPTWFTVTTFCSEVIFFETDESHNRCVSGSRCIKRHNSMRFRCPLKPKVAEVMALQYLPKNGNIVGIRSVEEKLSRFTGHVSMPGCVGQRNTSFRSSNQPGR
jgi:hypothetical protein